MNSSELQLVAPAISPALDPAFRPAVLARRAYLKLVQETGAGRPLTLALEQLDGSVSRFDTHLLPANHPAAGSNFRYVERLLKFLLWSRGGRRIHLCGAPELVEPLRAYYAENALGRFDSEIIGRRIYDGPIEVVGGAEAPEARVSSRPLGRHLDGCRIGFDLGGSDRKVAAVIDGQVVFSEETVWDPIRQADPQYHFDGIMDSLSQAAAHLPRVDAIGGSAAGAYVNNRVKVASLFRAVPPELFESRVRDIFFDVKRAWNDVPFEVANDGEVTALAGSMALEVNSVLGVAMGTSMAGGYVTPEGNITSWLNELAFAPIDYHLSAAADEWSADTGCGVQYFSQQAVGRLLQAAGIQLAADMPLPEKLREVQVLMAAGDRRAERIYQTLGTYFGYAVAHYADFYDLSHVLVLGRVTSGSGGETILLEANRVLEKEFPELFDRVQFHVPDEKQKRHGQAVAAASLPRIER